MIAQRLTAPLHPPSALRTFTEKFVQMAPTFKHIIESGQFTFLVGEEKKPITVHAAAISAVSDPLDRLINGNMSEAESRTATIPDVQVDDFIRFCEYAYHGDYTSAACEVEERVADEAQESIAEPERHDSPIAEQIVAEEEVVEAIPIEEPPVAENLEVHDPWGFGSVVKKKKKPKTSEVLSKQAKLRRELQRKNFAWESFLLKDAIHSRYYVTSNSHENEDFTPVFLAHARLYTFARMYLTNPLKELTLKKLQRTLLNFTLHPNRVGDVLELVRYVYSNEHTDDRKEDGTIDDLRELVVKYIACESDTFGTSSEFLELIEEGGEFVGDFWRTTRDYLI